MEKIIDYLKQLELSEIEAKLYITLLKSGPITVRELAERIDIKRTTAYLYIDQLVEKGLVVKLVKGSKKMIIANDPEDSLQSLVKHKVESANSIQTNFPALLEEISNVYPTAKDHSEIEMQYYKSKSGIKAIYKEALQSSELRLYVNLSEIAKVLPEDLNLFEEALAKNSDLHIYEIFGDTPNSLKDVNLSTQSDRYNYKFMPPHVQLSSADILIYDNKVAIINVKDKISGIVLYNADYFTNSKNLFDFIWTTLPETKL